MRILFVSHFIPHPPTGGASLRNYNLIKELAKTNDVHLVTFTQRARHPTRERERMSIAHLSEFCREVSVLDIPTDSSAVRWYGMLGANLLSREPYSAWRFRSKAFVAALNRQLDVHTFDVVHVDTIALAWCLRLLRGLPSLLNHHNIESQLLERRATTATNVFVAAFLRHQANKLRRAEEVAARSFDVNAVVSDVDRVSLLQLSPGALVQEVPNGTDTAFFSPLELGEEPNSLVFAGSMGWYPNADAMRLFASEIWPLIQAAVPDVKMNLIGSHPPEEVRQLAARDPNFRVLGFVDDVRPIIARSALYVVPIRVGGGTRLKILDAMAMGKAIISHPIGAEGIEVAEGSEIVIASTPAEFASSITALLGDVAARNRLAAAARKKAMERYSWGGIVPGLLAGYESAISCSARRL